MFDSDAGYVPDTPTYGLFFLLKAGDDPANWVRFWSGEHDLAVAPDAVDTAGGAYVPLGFPGGLPLISDVFNGAYTSGEFGLSGVDATAIRLLGEDRELVDGAQIHLGLQDFDGTAQPIGEIDWLTTLFAGKPGVRRQGVGEGATLTIVLPWVSGFFDRNLGAMEVLSAASQRRRSADDAFCDFLPRIQTGMIIPWPA